MKFEIQEKTKKNCFVVTGSKGCLKELKSIDLKTIEGFEIDESALNLGICLYGKTKRESIEIQRQNCKKILSLYDVCVKLIKFLKRKKYEFDGVFYVKNLTNKKNNNDFMLISMLDVKFNVGFFGKLSASYTYAATYLDKENSLNKMCDFRDNQCTKYRDLNKERSTGCCSKVICKYTCNAPCPTWNLACKIIMCDYLIEKKGYYFTPHTIPIMRKNFSFLERCFSIGQLCRTKKKALFELWLMRAFGLLVFVAAVVFGCLLFV